MLPLLFIKSLVQFHKATRVLVVEGGGGGGDEVVDGDLAMLALLTERDKVTVSVVEKGDLEPASAFLAHLEEDCLILDMAGFHREVQDRSGWFRASAYWVLPQGTLLGEPPEALRLDSNFVAIAEGEEGLPYEMREWYRIRGQLYSCRLGSWDVEGGLRVETPETWERRKDMMGLTVRAVTIPWTFFVLKSGDRDNGGFTGLLPDILRSLRAISNFTIDWATPPDGVFGAPTENGTWTGMVGMLMRGEADVAGTLAVTRERGAVISYNVAFIKSRGTLIVRNPSHFDNANDINLTAFLTVFSPGAWVLVGSMVVTVVAAHLAITSAKTSNVKLSSFSSSAAFGYKSFLKLDLPNLRAATSQNALFLTAAAVGVVVAAYYEGILTSYFTAKLPAPQLSSYSDAVRLGYKVVTLGGSKHQTDFENALPGTGRHAVYHKLMKDDPDSAFLPNMESLADALLSDPFTAMDFSEFVFANDRRFLPLTGLDDVHIDQVAFGLQRDSEMLPLFDYNMIRLYQSGTLSFIQDKWVGAREPKPTCDSTLVEGASSLGYTNLLFPALVLSCGGIAAPVVMLLEYLMKMLLRNNGH